MLDVLVDSLLDALKLLPFLLIIYILIELSERLSFLSPRKLNGRAAPLIGALTGLVPQCGFSVMAAKLYDKKYIRTGTLLAVFLATSDEAFVILLSSGSILPLLSLLGVKFLVAVSFGYLAYFALRRREQIEIGQGEEEFHSCGREHTHKPWMDDFVMPCLHALKITAYIFAVNLIFGTLFYFIGEENVENFLSANIFLQPLITTLVGLIPNCASSVILTQTFLKGGIAFGSCVAGLCITAGMGLVVLLRNVREWRRNLLLISTLFVISIAVGTVINLLSFLF